ncbi:MAG: VWA domain-containing protein [Muribaculaceae bacterium]|nr:VWA domain-containing protein [Muribaculaceae bacterium]
MTNRKNHILLLVLAIMTVATAMASHRERNLIYMVDCTKSMTGYGNNLNIWDDTKRFLHNKLNDIGPDDSYCIVPFQGRTATYKEFSGVGKESALKQWSEIEKYCDGIVNNMTNTDICGAWEYATSKIDYNKSNSLVILTDGKDNARGQNALYALLRSFCGKYPDTHCFYAMMTPAATDETIRSICGDCDEMHAIDMNGKITNFTAFEKLEITINTLELDAVNEELELVNGGTCAATVRHSDPHFRVSVVGGKIIDGKIPLKFDSAYGSDIQALNNALGSAEYRFNIEIAAEGYEIVNNPVSVIVENREMRKLATKEYKEAIDGASYYPSFLFWGEKAVEPIDIDLSPEWSKEALAQRSSVTLVMTSADSKGKPLADFQLLVDDQPAQGNAVTLNAGAKAPKLSVLFDNAAETGKRYLTLTATSPVNIDRINNSKTKDYRQEIRTRFSRNWNPLATILFWLGLILAAAIFVWFCCIRPMFVSVFKVTRMEIISDSDFTSKKIKGARRVVFTSKNKKDGLFARIFMPKTIYVVNGLWSYEWMLRPASGKACRPVLYGKYTIDPYSSRLEINEDGYSIENLNTSDKAKLIFR